VSTGTDQADQADQADGAGRRCTVPDCAERHVARGYCRPHYVRWRRHGDPHAEVPVAHRVRGAVSYWSTHQRVRAQRGPATAQRCAQCHAPAAVWSYDGTDPDERTDSTRGRRYSLDPGRYRPRCRSGRGQRPGDRLPHGRRPHRGPRRAPRARRRDPPTRTPPMTPDSQPTSAIEQSPHDRQHLRLPITSPRDPRQRSTTQSDTQLHNNPQMPSRPLHHDPRVGAASPGGPAAPEGPRSC
jgi:hypothetical protein